MAGHQDPTATRAAASTRASLPAAPDTVPAVVRADATLLARPSREAVADMLRAKPQEIHA